MIAYGIKSCKGYILFFQSFISEKYRYKCIVYQHLCNVYIDAALHCVVKAHRIEMNQLNCQAYHGVIMQRGKTVAFLMP